MSAHPLRFFDFGHLPPQLKEVASPFHRVAAWLVSNLPPSAERSAALRKLLEAKDCAVRAKVDETQIGHHARS